MLVLSDPPKPRARRGLLTAALVILALGVAFRWTGPWRQERTLRRASLPQLQRLARREPNNARVFHYLGLRARRAGQWDAAYDAFSRAVDLDNNDQESWLAAAELAGALHGEQGEFNLLALLLQNHPDCAPAHFALSEFYDRRGAYPRAYQEALAAAGIDPRNGAYWRTAGVEAGLAQRAAEAEAAFRRALALRPQDWTSRIGLGDALRERGRISEAMDCYRAAVAQAPGEAIPAQALARALLSRPQSTADSTEAQRLLLRAVGLRPDIAAIHSLLGQTYERQGDWPQARQALTEALRRDPRMISARYELARVDRHLGDARGAAVEDRRYERMLADWTRRHDLDSRLTVLPDDIPARLELARLCARNGDADEAAFQYRQILARRPAFAPAREELAGLTRPTRAPLAGPADLLAQADALRARKQWDQAERLYSQVFNGDHRCAPAAQGLGLICWARGQSRQALSFLAYATRLTPHLADAQAALAQMYRDAGLPDEARKRLETAAQDAPGRADLWHALGKTAGESTLYAAQAEQALARAVTLAPDNAAYRLDLAEQETADSRTSAAEADYRRALALAPHDPDALSRLGGFLVDASPTPPRLREAEGLLREALARDPHNLYARFARGRAALARGDARAAAADLRAVVTASPDIAEAWYGLARADGRLEDAAGAAQALARSGRLQDAYQARVHVQELIGRSPGDVGLRLRAARLFAADGENARALSEYEAATRLAPADGAARREMAALRTRLTAAGRLPDMALYHALLSSREKTP